MIKHYFYLIKPNIVIGNLISFIGGFSIASTKHTHISLFINTIIGVLLVIASSCVFNNIIDRDIDAIMERTKSRILISQDVISLPSSILYAIILSIFGFLLLGYTKNLWSISLTAIGMFIYIYIYSLWMKRKSIYSIIIGSISGAVPPVVGYCSVTNQFDAGAILLTIIFILWQIPHSYSIAIFRFNDYKAASIPTLPIKKGIQSTKNHMIIYIIGFIGATMLLTLMGYSSIFFLWIISIINLWWLYVGLIEYKRINDHLIWSKKMFFLSIIVILSFSLLVSIDSLLCLNK